MEPEAPFDAILVDAPCSATGTCRRHPDVLHRIAQIDELATLQAAMLARAAGWLRRADASSTPPARSNRPRARNRPGLHRAHPAPLDQTELPEGIAPTAQGWLRSDPGMLASSGGIDGFFAARWTA
jgi:16S rRNA (cytosine967-C5)-methyltransferase